MKAFVGDTLGLSPCPPFYPEREKTDGWQCMSKTYGLLDGRDVPAHGEQWLSREASAGSASDGQVFRRRAGVRGKLTTAVNHTPDALIQLMTHPLQTDLFHHCWVRAQTRKTALLVLTSYTVK